MGMYFPSIKITQVAWSLDRNVATALGIWSGWEYYTFWPFGWGVSTVSHEEIDWEGDMPAQDPYLFYSFNGAYSRSPRRVCFNRNCLRSGNQDPSGEWVVPPHRGVHSNSPSQRAFPLQIMVHNFPRRDGLGVLSSIAHWSSVRVGAMQSPGTSISSQCWVSQQESPD